MTLTGCSGGSVAERTSEILQLHREKQQASAAAPKNLPHMLFTNVRTSGTCLYFSSHFFYTGVISFISKLFLGIFVAPKINTAQMTSNQSLGQHMCLDQRTSQLKLRSEIVEDVYALLCSLTKTETLDYLKIRQESKTRIDLSPSHFNEVVSVPKRLIKPWTRSLSLVSVPGLYSDLDVEIGKYEGGFKVWEATNDLIKFLIRDTHVMPKLMKRRPNLRVLELGTGAGLASIALISRLISDRDPGLEFRIHLQDYNWQVLASFTLLNFAVNLPPDYLKALISTKNLRFFYGDWTNFRNQINCQYDFIMMSEAIYNSDNYQSLHDLLDRNLSLKGYVVIATKDVYFGLSGGLYSWLDFIESKNIFLSYKVFKVARTNIPRSILIMRRVARNSYQ